MRKAVTNITVFCLIIGMLSGCGFHLRGHNLAAEASSTKSLKQLSIQADKAKKLKKSLINSALSQGIEITDDSEFQLTINGIEKESLRASSNQSVSTDQFRLKLSVSYQISYQGNKLQEQFMTRQSIFQSNEDQALGKSYERESIYQELTDELAEALIEQLQTLNLDPPQCDCNETEPSTAQ